MLENEVLYLLSDQILNGDIFNKKFLEKLVSTLNKTKHFELLTPIKESTTNLLIEADVIDNTLTLYPENIIKSYKNTLGEYGIVNSSSLTKNMYKTLTLLHELTHVYQHNMPQSELKNLFLECIKIKEGYVLMNGIFDKLVMKSCNKLNLKILSEIYVTLISCSVYYKHHDLFPSERMADAYALSYIAKIYHIIGSTYFNDYANFLDMINYHLTKDYYIVKNSLSTPYKRFNALINRYGYDLSNIDTSKISEYDRVLTGIEEDRNVINNVIKNKILTKQV